MKRLLPLIALLLLVYLPAFAQDGSSSGTSYPDDSAAPTPTPAPAYVETTDPRVEKFADSMTKRAAILAVFQFNSKLSVFAPLASDPIACATAYKGLAYFNTVSAVVKYCDGTAWRTVTTSAMAAPIDATYITQTANASLTNEQALASLSSGIMRVATTTGVITSLTDSSGIAANISDETGSGALVFGTSPAITAPTGIVKGDVGLGNVDNTSDANKPVSAAQQTALDLKAPLASPVFTGTPTAPSIALTGTGGLGFTTYLSQSSSPSAPASGFREFADSTGRKSWIRASDGFVRTWDATLTASRVYTLPDADSKFPIFSQTITFAGPTAARTFTFPDASTTIAGLTDTQALTNKTINGNTFTTGTYTLTGGTGKTLTFNNSLTFSGTDGTTMTFPSTTASIARIDAAQTFAGANIFSSATTFNSTIQGNTIARAANGPIDISGGQTTDASSNVGVNLRSYRSFLTAGAKLVSFQNNVSEVAYVDKDGVVNSVLGFQISGAAASGNYLRGNGTNFVSSTIQSGDLPTALTPTTLTIGGGTAILKHLSATATLDFANLAAIGCENLTITVTGAALGDTVAIGVPNGSVVTNGTYFGWVSATDTVSIKFCTVVSGDPASGTFRADVTQH